MRNLAAVDPEVLVEADAVHHERVALPPPDRVTVEARRQLRWMFPAVHENRAVGMRAADVEDVGHLLIGQLDQFRPVRREPLTRTARRLAARVRFELHPASIVRDRSRPGHVRNRRAWTSRAAAEAATACCPLTSAPRAPRRRCGRGRSGLRGTRVQRRWRRHRVPVAEAEAPANPDALDRTRIAENDVAVRGARRRLVRELVAACLLLTLTRRILGLLRRAALRNRDLHPVVRSGGRLLSLLSAHRDGPDGCRTHSGGDTFDEALFHMARDRNTFESFESFGLA